MNSSVIRQKGESQNGCFKKTKYVKFSDKRTFLTPWFFILEFSARELKLDLNIFFELMQNRRQISYCFTNLVGTLWSEFFSWFLCIVLIACFNSFDLTVNFTKDVFPKNHKTFQRIVTGLDFCGFKRMWHYIFSCYFRNNLLLFIFLFIFVDT